MLLDGYSEPIWFSQVVRRRRLCRMTRSGPAPIVVDLCLGHGQGGGKLGAIRAAATGSPAMPRAFRDRQPPARRHGHCPRRFPSAPRRRPDAFAAQNGGRVVGLRRGAGSLCPAADGHADECRQTCRQTCRRTCRRPWTRWRCGNDRSDPPPRAVHRRFRRAGRRSWSGPVGPGRRGALAGAGAGRPCRDRAASPVGGRGRADLCRGRGRAGAAGSDLQPLPLGQRAGAAEPRRAAGRRRRPNCWTA